MAEKSKINLWFMRQITNKKPRKKNNVIIRTKFINRQIEIRNKYISMDKYSERRKINLWFLKEISGKRKVKCKKKKGYVSVENCFISAEL